MEIIWGLMCAPGRLELGLVSLSVTLYKRHMLCARRKKAMRECQAPCQDSLGGSEDVLTISWKGIGQHVSVCICSCIYTLTYSSSVKTSCHSDEGFIECNQPASQPARQPTSHEFGTGSAQALYRKGLRTIQRLARRPGELSWLVVSDPGVT